MMFSVVQKPAGGESGLIAAFIMLLGSIVRCWSETGMNSCPEPMVRRRQPYSSALFAMQAESQGDVWYISMLDLLDRALLCGLVP
jgi:hypothetical protein